LTLMTSKPRSTSPSDMSCAGVLLGRWCNTALMGFFSFGIEGILRKGIFYLVVHHILGDYPGPIPGITELEALLGHAFQLFLQLDEVGCRRQYYWGRPARFYCSCCLCSVGLCDRWISVHVDCPEGGEEAFRCHGLCW
jgi:hypothetical protein